MRWRISITAVRVKLTIQIRDGWTPSAMSLDTLRQATHVLPVPGPALTAILTSASAPMTASCAGSLSGLPSAGACQVWADGVGPVDRAISIQPS